MERPANYRPLSPISFLERTAEVSPKKQAVAYGEKSCTYGELASRVYRLASALQKRGIGKGDCVAFLCPNIPPMLEAHYGVPLTQGFLCSINIRLAAREVEYILNHSGSKILFVDTEFSSIIEPIRR